MDPFPMSPVRPRRKPGGRGSSVTVAGAAVTKSEATDTGGEAGAGRRAAASTKKNKWSLNEAINREDVESFVVPTRPWKSSITVSLENFWRKWDFRTCGMYLGLVNHLAPVKTSK